MFDADIKIRVLTPKDVPLVLECTNRSAGDKAQWLKEKAPVITTLGGNEDILKIDNETGTLEILKDVEEVYGNYTCKVANSTTEYRVVRKYSSATTYFASAVKRYTSIVTSHACFYLHRRLF